MYYYKRNDKTLGFLEHIIKHEDGSIDGLTLEEVASIKEVTNEEFVLAENDYYYLKEDLASPEYIDMINELHKNDEICSLHRFLLNTDYIVMKIYEAQINNDLELLNNLKAKYAEKLIERQQARERLNELENA